MSNTIVISMMQVTVRIISHEGREGRGGGGPNPISQEIVFFQIRAQIPQSQPVLLKLKSYCFFFMNPSPSAQNPISQPLKKANPSSHFTPSRPSLTCQDAVN